MGKKSDITPRKRAKIEVLLMEGIEGKLISQKIGVSTPVISKLKKKLFNNDSLSPSRKGKCGRKKITTTRDDAVLLREAKQNRRATSGKLQQHMSTHGVKISTRTIRRRLFENGLKARRPRKKQKLTPAMVKKRLEWAKQLKNWTSNDWKKVRYQY